MNSETCVCGNPKSFNRCCGRFLSGRLFAKTPEQLMRSRFSAYALGGHGDYLLATWFPATARGLTVPQLSERALDWQRLEVIARSQRGDAGMVEFRAWYRQITDNSPASDVPESGALEVMHEVSEFRRVGGRWLYVGGRVR